MSAKRKPITENALADAAKALESVGYTAVAGKARGARHRDVQTFVHRGKRRDGVVLIERKRYDRLVAASEDRGDEAAIDRGRSGGSTYLPAEMVNRLIAGESAWRVWREHRGLTLAQLAAKAAKQGAAVSKGQLSHIENGRSHASLVLASAVARALDIPLDNLAP